ncbi:hypothetical protein ZWY2020_011103 [Hordeum vulgare]|nr:hypothetical protein ZWY2020_011103 [Hordeum vulgare]
MFERDTERHESSSLEQRGRGAEAAREASSTGTAHRSSRGAAGLAHKLPGVMQVLARLWELRSCGDANEAICRRLDASMRGSGWLRAAVGWAGSGRGSGC